MVTLTENHGKIQDMNQAQLAVIEHTDASTWNQLVLEHPYGHTLQSWQWGELKGKFGWQPMRIAVTNGEKTAAAQILFQSRYGLSVAYVPRGPLWANDELLDRALLQTLRRITRQRRAIFLRLEPNILENAAEANRLHSFLQVSGFSPSEPVQPRSTIHLDLHPSSDDLFANFSKGHRADVRRAGRLGVTIRPGTTAADLNTFYAILEETGARQNFGNHVQAYYEAAWRIFGDDACLLLAEQNGEAVAAFLVFAWGREAQYMYSGATTAGLKNGVNHLLQWHAIQWARERGCQLYDLWGIPDAFGKMLHATEHDRSELEQTAKAHPLYGVYRFKKGWGGKIVRYLPAYDQVYIAPAYWLWQRRRNGSE
jgi:lipid II:glycine glycyltransferase (peptidoglycan interpeptide bridge formation enzyme)